MLGIYGPPKAPEKGGTPRRVGLGEDYWISLCGRGVPVKETDDGVRAVVKDKPIKPESARKYLQQKFGKDLGAVRDAMCALAQSYDPDDLGDAAYGLYERFRPEIPQGKRGWGAKGELSLELIRSLAGR
jgi:hypothetical protein